MGEFSEVIDHYEKSMKRWQFKKWYRFDSVQHPDILKYLVLDYHNKGLIEFTLNADHTKFRMENDWANILK